MSSQAIFDAAAILACSLMAVLVSVDRHRRFGAAMAVGVVASISGGTLRDVFLGILPVFWVRQPWQIYLAFAATAGFFFLLRRSRVREPMLLVPDALSVALPAAIAARTALEHGYECGIAGAVGIIAGMMGGIFRDVLCEREPAVLKRELYGTAALIGAICVCLCARAGCGAFLQSLVGILAGAGARIAAVHYHISFGRLVLHEGRPAAK